MTNPSAAITSIDQPFIAAVEAIYEAAPEPERWPQALDLVGRCFGDHTVNMFWQRDDGSRGMLPSLRCSKELSDAYNEKWWPYDIRAIRAFERGFMFARDAVTDRHLVTEEEMATHPFFTHYITPFGCKWLMATIISPDLRVPVAIVVHRGPSKPAFSDDDLLLLTKLGRHAEKSLRLSMRLFDAELSSLGLSDALSRFGMGVFVLDALGRIVFSNSAAQRHVDDGFVVAEERLVAAFAADREVLGAALSSMLRGASADLAADPRPILVRRRSSERPLAVYVLPLRGSRDAAIEHFLVRAKAIVLVVDPEPEQPPDPTVVRDVLGLTLSEARLAALVGSGVAPREAAETLNITEGTARVVLKRIFSKVGISRQSELSALITKLVLR